MYKIDTITLVQILSTSAPKPHDKCMIFSTALILIPNVISKVIFLDSDDTCKLS